MNAHSALQMEPSLANQIVPGGGLNIAPRGMEPAIEQRDNVTTVPIIRLSHERLGQDGCICVIAQGPLKQINAHLAFSGFTPFTLPRCWKLPDKLIATACGTAQRHQLIGVFLEPGSHLSHAETC